MNLWLAAESQSKSFPDIFSSTEVIAALLGAFVGGFMTYWATSRLEKRKQRKLELSLSSLVLLEVLDHLASLEFALDKVLPHWLKRNRATYEKDYLLENTSILNAQIYNQFFGVLAATEFGPFLILHYKRLPEYNSCAEKQPVKIPFRDLSFYVQNLARLMDGGIDLSDRLRRLRGMRRLINPEFQAGFQLADEHRERRYLMAALCRTNQKEIENLIEGKPVSSGMPEAILKASHHKLKNWIQ
jgi:hypothetical protein